MSGNKVTPLKGHLMELRKGLFKGKSKLSYGILFDNLE
ncbi:hypothetical protein S3E15_02766 [Bacillus mycoides]|uniref:Uncharacterized protein n=1 Tax=Bacillus mycoides TaxID=1405 RepID=A0AAP8BD69_BACMY|nr:hypothetical protein B4117_5484 [Bacillus mycoides]OSX90130.1 hypothetical protein S3E15_02766 [Bacillus mycoides]